MLLIWGFRRSGFSSPIFVFFFFFFFFLHKGLYVRKREQLAVCSRGCVGCGRLNRPTTWSPGTFVGSRVSSREYSTDAVHVGFRLQYIYIYIYIYTTNAYIASRKSSSTGVVRMYRYTKHQYLRGIVLGYTSLTLPPLLLSFFFFFSLCFFFFFSFFSFLCHPKKRRPIGPTPSPAGSQRAKAGDFVGTQRNN